MAAIVHKTSRAEEDITAAITWLLDVNPGAAVRFVSALESLVHRLSRFPELYPLQRRSARPEWQNVRMAVLRGFGHVVFYTVENDRVVIRRVIHGAQNNP